MFKPSDSKVKFQDQQLDDYLLENSVLKSKLQSKIDALTIMSKELDKCSMERDRYKFLVEQLKCKKSIPLKDDDSTNVYRFTPTNSISGGDMLAKTREHNNMLKLEVELLHSQLDEATGDIEALRKQLQRKYVVLLESDTSRTTYSFKEYEQLVEELEKLQKKYQQIQLDYQATLDEKQELVLDRDYYKNKVQRLNQQISYILSNSTKAQNSDSKGDPKRIVDIDSLVTKNKYLQDIITNMQVEKEVIMRALKKYKTLLDNRSKNYPDNVKRGFTDVMTQKQAREFLERNMNMGSKHDSTAELKSLCLGLFEAMNDKSVALQHQKKTNRILANRIIDLEKTLDSWCNGQKYIPIFPSQMLLDEFFPDAETPKKTATVYKSNSIHCFPTCTDEKNKEKHSERDDEIKISDSSEGDSISNGEENENQCENTITTKTELPEDLQELVKEALAELKPDMSF